MKHINQAANGADLLTEEETADYIRMSVSYLRADRVRGTIGGRTPGPAYLKLGRSIRYQKSDLDTWLAESRVDRMAVG